MSDRLRRFLVALFLIGAVGTGIELWLLEHTEDAWQWAPLALLMLSVLVLGVSAATRRPGAGAVETFRVLMVLMVLSGGIGTWLHYRGNVEFELEMYPGRNGWELIWESLKGATPSLAPGAMLHLGLLGLLCTFQHPAFKSEPDNAGD